MEKILEIFESQRSLGIIYLDVYNLTKIENDFGSDIYDSVQRDLTEAIFSLQGKYLRKKIWLSNAINTTTRF